MQQFTTYDLNNGKKSEVKVSKGSNLSLNYNTDNEENAKRTLKATMHLAKLNGAKENKQPF